MFTSHRERWRVALGEIGFYVQRRINRAREHVGRHQLDPVPLQHVRGLPAFLLPPGNRHGGGSGPGWQVVVPASAVMAASATGRQLYGGNSGQPAQAEGEALNLDGAIINPAARTVPGGEADVDEGRPSLPVAVEFCVLHDDRRSTAQIRDNALQHPLDGILAARPCTGRADHLLVDRTANGIRISQEIVHVRNYSRADSTAGTLLALATGALADLVGLRAGDGAWLNQMSGTDPHRACSEAIYAPVDGRPQRGSTQTITTTTCGFPSGSAGHRREFPGWCRFKRGHVASGLLKPLAQPNGCSLRLRPPCAPTGDSQPAGTRSN